MRNPDKTIEVSLSMQLSELIEEINSSPEEIFRIIVPSGAKLLRSEVGLKLLKEKSASRNKKLVFMTDDEVGKILLARSGFIVKPITKKRPENDYFETLASANPFLAAKMSDIRKTKKNMTEIRPVRKEEVEGAKGAQREEEKETKRGMSRVTQFISIRRANSVSAKPIEQPTREKSAQAHPHVIEEISSRAITTRRPIFLYIAIFVIAAALIVFVLSFFILPSAKIEITPKRTAQAINAAIAIAPSVKELSQATNEVPGQFVLLEREFSMSFRASGRKYVEAHAIGNIRVFNEYSSSPQRLVANTRFLSSDGRLFRTTREIIVPGARIENGKIVATSIEVPVRADETGDRHNIGPSTFTIPGFQGSARFTGFYGKSESDMSGGFEGDAQVVTEEDLANARRTLEERVFALLEQEWPLRVPKELTVLEEGKIKQVDEVNFSAEADAPVSTFQGTIHGSINLIAFREADLESLMRSKAETFTDEQTNIESLSAFSFSNAQFNPSAQRFSVNVASEATIVADINESRIVDMIVGKNEAEIRSLLAAEPGIERAKITLWPFWADSVTEKANKVRVDID